MVVYILFPSFRGDWDNNSSVFALSSQTNAPNLEFVEPMQLRITADAFAFAPRPKKQLDC